MKLLENIKRETFKAYKELEITEKNQVSDIWTILQQEIEKNC